MKIPESCEDEQSDESQPQVPEQGHGENGSNGNHGNHIDTSEQQRHEEAMFSAIDAICSSTEQTYDQFLQCFSYFKPGLPDMRDLDPSTSNMRETVNVHTQNNHAAFPTNPHGYGHVTQMSGSHGNQVEDELDEEVLSAVTMRPAEASDSDKQSKPIVKMDNFVDDEGEPSDDDDGDGDESGHIGYDPYTPSFSHNATGGMREHQETHTRHVTASPPSLNSQDETVTNTSNPDHPYSADLPPEVRYDSTGAPVVLDDSADCPRVEADPDGEHVSYDPEQDLPNPGEITDNDIEGCNDCVPTVREITNIRLMGYSAKFGDMTSMEVESGSNGGVQVHSEPDVTDTDPGLDEVEAFSLDEDFDYDNVILTPKYTAEEVKLFRTAMGNKT